MSEFKNYLETPLLSVVVPVGNMAGQLDFIEVWLQKVEKYQIEVIFVHDQTYNEVGAELEQLLMCFNPQKVKLTAGVFGNPGGARNAGIDLAKGEWIAFWDCDDYPHIEEVYGAILQANDLDEILIGNFTVFDVTRSTLRETKLTAKGTLNSIIMNPGIWRMIFRSNIIGPIRFPNLRMAEDQVFLSYLELASRKLKFIESVFYQYNIGGPSQLTRSRIALKDLPFASRLIFEHALVASKGNSFFDLQLFCRQQITMMNRGDFVSKIETLRSLGKFFTQSRIGFLLEALSALTQVLKNMRKSRF